MDPTTRARLVSVNVGDVRTIVVAGRRFTTGIYKQPVAGSRRVAGVNLEGDHQADRRVHGGPTKSLYAYAFEDYEWWSGQLGRTLSPGTFGDNLTTAGITPAAAVVGERWAVGSAVLRVTEPRIPCFKLGVRMEDRRFPARFAAAARPGTYLAIERAGAVAAGDAVAVIDRPDHGVTVGDIERAYHVDRSLAVKLVGVAELSDGWRGWAREVLRARA
ncbi:MAG TPA: MOSC domain-containing protein [Euzebyales bacterium]|nr:MOSC domain-containing protein [Euzebyales bacterium]